MSEEESHDLLTGEEETAESGADERATAEVGENDESAEAPSQAAPVRVPPRGGETLPPTAASAPLTKTFAPALQWTRVVGPQ